MPALAGLARACLVDRAWCPREAQVLSAHCPSCWGRVFGRSHILARVLFTAVSKRRGSSCCGLFTRYSHTRGPQLTSRLGAARAIGASRCCALSTSPTPSHLAVGALSPCLVPRRRAGRSGRGMDSAPPASAGCPRLSHSTLPRLVCLRRHGTGLPRFERFVQWVREGPFTTDPKGS